MGARYSIQTSRK